MIEIQVPELNEANSAVEQRATVRRRKLAPIDVVSGKKGVPFRGWLVDHSLGGFRLLLPRKFALDHIISIRPPNASETVPWLQLLVKSCQQKENQWEMGCALQSSPSYSVLLSYW